MLLTNIILSLMCIKVAYWGLYISITLLTIACKLVYELFILLYVMSYATLKAVAVLLNLTVPQMLRLRCYVVLIKLA